MINVIRVFPKRTKWTPVDEFSFVGDPPLFRPGRKTDVKISVSFTWDIPEGERLYKEWGYYFDSVELGGPAYGDPGSEFTPGMFLKDGCVITSRGCIKKCKWCHVWPREGNIRELPITEGWIIQDNNLLACSKDHIINVFDMLRDQPSPAIFKGGLDKDLLKDWHIELLHTIRVGELWFACDSDNGLKKLEQTKKMLDGISKNKLRCYTMIGYGGSIDKDVKRMTEVFNLGFLPFAQLYQPEERIEYSQEWVDIARIWSRPAITKSIMKDNSA